MELNQELWRCSFGSTPEFPDEAVLCADLPQCQPPPPPRSAPPAPVPTQRGPKGKTIFLEAGQAVVPADRLERLQAAAAAPLTRRREADTLSSIAADAVDRTTKM